MAHPKSKVSKQRKNKRRLKNRPDEKPIEVITRVLEFYSDDYIDEETEIAVKEGIK